MASKRISQEWNQMIGEGERRSLQDAYAQVRQRMSEEWTRRSYEDAMDWRERLLEKEPWRDLEVQEGTPYQMDGESGFWSFKTFQITDRDNGRTVYDTRSKLPVQKGKTRLRTKGAEELMLFFSMSHNSTRRSTALLNRIRHQDQPVAPTTLRDFTERKGLEIAEALDEAVQTALKAPEPEVSSTPASVPKEVLESAFAEANVPPELIEEAKANPVPYSDPGETCNVGADAVFCKKQKEQRSADAPPPGKKDRKTVSTSCAFVSFEDDRIALTSLEYTSLAWSVIAVLRVNNLVTKACCFLSDGERKLKETFAPLLSKSVAFLYSVLDWYHLQSRCSQLLSSALKGKDVRNAHREVLMRYLWYGCTSSAISYLYAIPKPEVKRQGKLDELISYLKRRTDQIPVYAVRRALGLANGSSRVEKLNHLLVSSRQKGKGVSWSQEGSFAQANIRMVDFNEGIEQWLDDGIVSLEFIRDARKAS